MNPKAFERSYEASPHLCLGNAEHLRSSGHGKSGDASQQECAALAGRQRGDRRAHESGPRGNGFGELWSRDLENLAGFRVLDDFRDDVPQERGKRQLGRVAGRGQDKAFEGHDRRFGGCGGLACALEQREDRLAPSSDEAGEGGVVPGRDEQQITGVWRGRDPAPGECHRLDSARVRKGRGTLLPGFEEPGQ